MKASWYKPYQAIWFCPPTRKGNLVRMLSEIVKKEKMEGGMDIKIAEKAGIRTGKILPGLNGKEDHILIALSNPIHLMNKICDVL